jgi:outer membrane protein assembly factor BamB
MHDFRHNQFSTPLPDDEPETIDLDAPTSSDSGLHLPRSIFRHLFSGQRFTRTARVSLSLLAVACFLIFVALIFPTVRPLSQSRPTPTPTAPPPDLFTYNNVQVTEQVIFADSINPYTSINSPGHGTLNIFQSRTGHLLWKSNLYPPQTALSANNVLYVQTYTGAVRALDILTGRVIWQSTAIAHNGQLHSIADGILFDVLPDSSVSAIRASDGHPLWLWHSHLTGIVMIQLAGNSVYISSMQDKLTYALQKDSGHLLWSYQQHGGGYVGSAGTDVVYIITQLGTIDALHATNGTLLWSRPTIDSDGIIYDRVEEISHGLIVLASSQASALRVLHMSDGTLAWTYKSKSSDAIAALGITLWYDATADYVYVLSPDDDTLLAFHLTSGTRAWSYNVGIPFSFSLQDDTIYLSYDREGILLALHADTGKMLWTYQEGAREMYATAIAHDVVYLQSEQGGRIDAISVSNHELLWSQQIQSS